MREGRKGNGDGECRQYFGEVMLWVGSREVACWLKGSWCQDRFSFSLFYKDKIVEFMFIC